MNQKRVATLHRLSTATTPISELQRAGTGVSREEGACSRRQVIAGQQALQVRPHSMDPTWQGTPALLGPGRLKSGISVCLSS